MEVILLERVAKLGQMGEIVKVRDGFARNFLLKRKKALRATTEDGVFNIHFCTYQIGAIDLRASAASACGLVDIAPTAGPHSEAPDAMPTIPQAKQQQTVDNRP